MMKKEIVKIRVLCGVSGEPSYGYIRYEDEVPDETHAWKGTRRHNDESIVELGEVWSNPVDYDNGDGVFWNAYAILDANASKEEKIAKAEELCGIVLKKVADEAGKLMQKAESARFDLERFSTLMTGYDGD